MSVFFRMSGGPPCLAAGHPPPSVHAQELVEQTSRCTFTPPTTVDAGATPNPVVDMQVVRQKMSLARRCLWGPNANADALKRILAKGADPNETWKNAQGVERSLLMEAQQPARVEAFRALVEAGADVERPFKDLLGNAETAIFFAVETKDVPLVKLLIAKGAKVNVESGGVTNRSPLGIAVLAGDAPMVKVLLDAGSDPKSTLTSPAGATPTAWLAVATGNLEIVKMVVEKGADVNLAASLLVPAKGGGTEIQQTTPLKLAIDKKSGAIEQYLRSKGAAR